MTKSQCYSEISRNRQLINQYQNQIDILNREINELTDAKSKVANMKNTLSSCKQTSIGRLAGMSIVNRINSKIVNKFYNNMNNLFEGAEYAGIFNGLNSGIGRIDDEITRKRNQIRNLRNQIADCENRINEMYNRIAQIEAAERAEAERRAREAEEAARRAAEEAANKA